MPGYIKIYRTVEDHWIWKDPRKYQWWTLLIIMAAYSRKKVYFGNKEIIVERGQIATTIRNLTKSFMCAKQTVCDFLVTLEKDGMIKKESSSIMTLITITNYDKYQGSGDDEDNTDERPLIDQKVGHLKKNKEIKKKNNSKESYENLVDEKFFNEDAKKAFINQGIELTKPLTIDEGITIFKQNTKTLESFCMNNKLAIDEIDNLLSLFKEHCLRNGKTNHPTLNKFNEHFRNSLKYLLPKLRKAHPESKDISTIKAQETLTDYSDTDFGGRKY